jgi:hypothetical protein
MLPAPRKAALGPAPRWLARRARRCVGRLRSAGRINAMEQAWARIEVDRLLAGESGRDEDPPADDAPAMRGAPGGAVATTRDADADVGEAEPVSGPPTEAP